MNIYKTKTSFKETSYCYKELLINFGLVEKYRESHTSKYTGYKKDKNLTGTLLCASMNAYFWN